MGRIGDENSLIYLMEKAEDMKLVIMQCSYGNETHVKRGTGADNIVQL